MQNLKHIYFDLDNTLWDHRKNSEITLQQMFHDNFALNDYDLSFDDWHDVFVVQNEILWANLRDGHIDKKELRERRFKDAFEHFKIFDKEIHNDFELNYLNFMGKKTEVVEGAVELLEYLKPKYSLHIITNGFEEVSYEKVNNSTLQGYFQTLTTADEVHVRKPNPIIFKHALAKNHALPEESLLIGDDWIADVHGALNMGMRAIFFNSLDEEHEWISSVPEVKSLIEIKNIL